MDFWIPAGSQNGAKTDPEDRSKLIFSRLFAPEIRFFAFSSLGRVPEGSRSDSGGSGDPSGPDFERILRYFFAGCVRILSGFVGFRQDVAGIRAQPQ